MILWFGDSEIFLGDGDGGGGYTPQKCREGLGVSLTIVKIINLLVCVGIFFRGGVQMLQDYVHFAQAVSGWELEMKKKPSGS